MLCGFLRMFLLRLVSIWALINVVDPAPQWLNSRFGRRVIQLSENNSTSTAGNREQNANRWTFPRVNLFQDLQPPNFGLLNKLPYLTLQPPLFALPQELADDVHIPLPGPASNSVELEKRSKENYVDQLLNETTTDSGGAKDVKPETSESFGNNKTVLSQVEPTNNYNSEISNGDSTTVSLDLPSETPTTEVIHDDLSSSSVVVASRRGKEPDETAINTKIISETQTASNDETSTQSERSDFDYVKTTSVFESTSNEFESGRRTNVKLDLNTFATQTVNDLTTGQPEIVTSDRNIERNTETTANKEELTEVINTSHGTTSANDLITLTTTNDSLDDTSATRSGNDEIKSTELTNTNLGFGSIETTSLATTESGVSTNQNDVELTEVANINSRYGSYETTTAYNGIETENSFSAEIELGIAPTESSVDRVDLTEAKETTSPTTLANAFEDVASTTENKESSTSQVILNNLRLTEDVVLDEPTTVSTDDLEISNFLSEEVASGSERGLRASNLEYSTENPSIGDQNDEQVTVTNAKNDESTELTFRYGLPEQKETTTEELVTVNTATSNDGVDRNVAEDVSTSNLDASTSPTVQASSNTQKLESRISNEEEITVSELNEVQSPTHLPPLESIKSDVSVSYGLTYKPDSNDIMYTISTTVKSVLLHKSEEDGNVTSEVNAAVNATSVLQDQSSAPGFSTSLAGNVSSIGQGPRTEVAGDSPREEFGIEFNKTEDAPEINIRLLPPLQFGVQGRLGDSKLTTTNPFDHKEGFGRNTFTIPSNTQFTVNLDKSGRAPPNFSVRFNNASEPLGQKAPSSDFGTIRGYVGGTSKLDKSGAQPNFSARFNKVQENEFGQKASSDSGSLWGYVGGTKKPGSSRFSIELDKSGAQPNYSVRFNNAPGTSLQSYPDGRQFYDFGSATGDLGGSRNDKQMDHVSLVSPSRSLSVQFSSTPNVNVLGRQNVPQDSAASASVKGTLPPAAHTGINIQEQINLSSVINIGNQSLKSARVDVNNAEPKPTDPDKSSKFRSVTIDASEPNDPTELLKNYNKNPGALSPPPQKYVQAKYVGETSVSKTDEKIARFDDGFKRKYGFDLGFLSRGIDSKLSRGPPRTQAPRDRFDQPIGPRAFDRSDEGSNKAGTFGLSIGPYRDTLIKHTGKGWSLRTYDKLILHTGLSGQYL